jgi:hypothetical protein
MNRAASHALEVLLELCGAGVAAFSTLLSSKAPYGHEEAVMRRQLCTPELQLSTREYLTVKTSIGPHQVSSL